MTTRRARLILPGSRVRGTYRAAWLMATSGRPAYLAATLRTILAQLRPPGWTMGVVVIGPPGDPGAQVAARFEGVQWVSLDSDLITDRYNAGLDVIGQVDSVLLSGDDDYHSPFRLCGAVGAYLEGFRLSGLSSFYRINLSTFATARWSGNPWRAGAGLNLPGRELVRSGGWPTVPENRGIDWALQQRALAAGWGEDPFDLVDACGWGTAYGAEAPGSRSGPLPWPALGESNEHGNFTITGTGPLLGWARAGLGHVVEALDAEGVGPTRRVELAAP